MKATVLFDEDCAFCRSLAEFARSRTRHLEDMEFQSWQFFKQSASAKEQFEAAFLNQDADKLRIITDNEILEEARAWDWLLAHFPDFKAFSWLAQKVGLERQSATLLHKTSRAFRTLCRSCRKK